MTVLHTAHLRAKLDAIEAYKARLVRHARTSLEREPGGCLRFDVHQDRNDPTLFFLIEVYRDEAALAAHRNSAHFAEYRRDTDEWILERQWWYWQALEAPASSEPNNSAL
jgi:(4S)-4-hydroxy-5-phosphonooxypentane-2,3-dione isomerase